MKKTIALATLMIAASLLGNAQTKAADIYGHTHVHAMNFAATRPWHGGYQYQNWGTPLAVITPPGAHMQTNYSWGVSQNLMYPLYHQYQRHAPQPTGVPRGVFRQTPHWPSHTDQFGLYYIRGPW